MQATLQAALPDWSFQIMGGAVNCYPPGQSTRNARLFDQLNFLAAISSATATHWTVWRLRVREKCPCGVWDELKNGRCTECIRHLTAFEPVRDNLKYAESPPL